jgi:general stress protein 26
MNDLYHATQIVRENIYCSLATASKNGEPWNSPVYYSYDHDLNLYWASSIEAMHSQFLKVNPIAFIAIYKSTAAPRTATALYLKGQVEIVLDGRLNDVVQQHFKRVNEKTLFTGNDYRDPSPERFYQFTPQKVWILGKPITQQGHLIDTRIELSINELKEFLKRG